MHLLHFAPFYVAERVIPFMPGARPNVQAQIYVVSVVLPILLAVSALSHYAFERPCLRSIWRRPNRAPA